MLYDEFVKDAELKTIRAIQDDYAPTAKWLIKAVEYLGDKATNITDYLTAYDALTGLKEAREVIIRKEYHANLAKLCKDYKEKS